ncbi:excisionase family protein [Erwinia amylovora]|uniref:excisionase family protein n=1 Tax=Erwinia amylovora TaxID=552 RepID=UPI001444094C|nr:excisionase family protein [Erwinia amylovora]
MAQVIFKEEWMVAAGLMEKTGLSDRQIKELRCKLLVEGIHFKRIPFNGKTDTGRGLVWYNFPLINKLVQES